MTKKRERMKKVGGRGGAGRYAALEGGPLWGRNRRRRRSEKVGRPGGEENPGKGATRVLR